MPRYQVRIAEHRLWTYEVEAPSSEVAQMLVLHCQDELELDHTDHQTETFVVSTRKL